MNRTAFERIVQEALADLPEDLRARLQNVEIVIEDRPSRTLLRELEMDPGEETLYGLYQGTPLTERHFDDVVQVPDTIFLYRESLLEDFGDDPEVLREEIRTTVIHEIAHFFGIDDDRLEDLGWE